MTTATVQTKKPEVYSSLTQHLLRFSKHHYGRTSNILEDLAIFMHLWSWSPIKCYTPHELYRIVSYSFVESCNKGQIEEFIRDMFSPWTIHHWAPGQMTIEEAISSMLGQMACTQILDRDKDGNLYELVHLEPLNKDYYINTEAWLFDLIKDG